jgi:hypothetical protein
MAENCDRLTDVGLDQRNRLLGLNVYNQIRERNYGSTHPNALADSNGSDDPTNVKGKGTGVFLDTFNGGGTDDIEGTPSQPGSGRIKNILVNKFNIGNTYKAPDLDDRQICPVGITSIGSL